MDFEAEIDRADGISIGLERWNTQEAQTEHYHQPWWCRAIGGQGRECRWLTRGGLHEVGQVSRGRRSMISANFVVTAFWEVGKA